MMQSPPLQPQQLQQQQQQQQQQPQHCDLVDVKPSSISLAAMYLDPHYAYSNGIMLWDQTKQLPQLLLTQVEDAYKKADFPLEVRLHLAEFIEEKFSPTVPFIQQDPQHQELAAGLAQEMLAKLSADIEAMPNDPDQYLKKQMLAKTVQNLTQTYASNLVGLYMVVRHCLEEEMKIGQQAPSGGSDANVGEQIRLEIANLKQRVSGTSSNLDKLRQDQEDFLVEYCSCKEYTANYNAFLEQSGEQHPDFKKHKAKKEALEKDIQIKYIDIRNKRTGLIETYLEIFNITQKVQMQVLDKELIRWKREQQLAGNGNPFTFSLETLQEWCEGLADIIWPMRQQVKQMEGLMKMVKNPQNEESKLPDLMAGIVELLSALVTGTFIIEKHPPQVMKTNTRFTSTVRLLVGGVLNVHMVAPNVSVSIVSESQANHLLTSPNSKTTPKKKQDYNSGDILNGNGTMEFHNATKQVSVSFRNLQLKKIKRTEKKGTESVMDEKFAVLFWTEFTVGELRFQLWTLSLPVVVIVHGNQEPQALATVTWDNAFAEWGRPPFVVPDGVSWAQAGAALNMKWTAACGSPLTQDNLYYLACKAFRNNKLSRVPDEYNQMKLTWSLFCKETLPNRNFTFWEWFYRILLLTSNHMQRIWKDCFVMGFVDKQDAETMLLQKQQPGYFLMRFSDSILGGVTIAYTKFDYQNLKVCMVEPFTTKDLSQRSIGDVIFDLNDLLCVLYPEVPKEVLRKFCSATTTGQSNSSANGYVKHMLVTQVEGQVTSSLDSNPATPLSYDIPIGNYSGDLDQNHTHQQQVTPMDGVQQSMGAAAAVPGNNAAAELQNPDLHAFSAAVSQSLELDFQASVK